MIVERYLHRRATDAKIGEDTQRWRWIWAKGVSRDFGLFRPYHDLKSGFVSGLGKETWA